MALSLWMVTVLLAAITADPTQTISPFIPALPGETPACAKKGKSFCEYVQGYPEHVIGYLLERGAFDTNTLFMSESNVKPPQFNKTEEPVEVKARHRYLPYNYAPTYIPKPVNELLSHFTRVPFSKQIYRDYLDYYKSQEDNHYYLAQLGPSTARPPHYLPAQPPPQDTLYFNDLTKVRFPVSGPQHSDGAPKVVVKSHSQAKGGPTQQPVASPTPYKYKIIKDSNHHVKPSVKPQTKPHEKPQAKSPTQPQIKPSTEPKELSPESRQLPDVPDRVLSTPNKSYLPPPPSHPPPPPHHHHHPAHPSPSLSAPVESYLPPPTPEAPPAEPQTGYLPPHKSYLPPSPTLSLPPHHRHNPTLANIKELHTLPSLEEVQRPHHPSVIFPQINEAHDPHPQRGFIGPQLPPNRPPPPPPQPHSQSVPKFPIAGHFEDNRIDFSNKKRLQEALKNFNAKPNIDQETGGLELQSDIDLISDLANNQLEQLQLATQSVGLLNTQTTPMTEPSPTTTTSPTTTPVPTTSKTSTTSTTTTSTSQAPRLRIDEFLPEVSSPVPVVLDLARDNDGFVFGPQPRPVTHPSLVFSSPLPESDSDQVNDIILGDIEILITGRGDKTLKPRSFTPSPLPSLSSTQSSQEINFQPGPFKRENYRVTEFSRETTPGGHSYRLTTPTSTVFVQRSFGHQDTPVSSRTLTLKREINQTVSSADNTTEAVFDSLQDAVDVLTRSSLGYMNQKDIDQNNLALENDIQTIQKEIETLQKDIEILNNADITFDLTDEENRDEIFSLKHNLDELVQGLDDVPVDIVENHKDKKNPQLKFQHFPVVNVENIYDANAIESLLEDFTDTSSVGGGESVPEVIQSNQFDDILLSNYLVSSHHTNQPGPLLQEVQDVQENKPTQTMKDSVPRRNPDIIHGKPIEKVAGPPENIPRAEKLVSIPDSVSSFITSVKSFISYNGVEPPAVPSARPRFTPATTEKLGLGDVALKSNPVVESEADHQYLKYISSPALNTPSSTQPSLSQHSQQDNVSLKDQDQEDFEVQKFWPGTKLNVTYQENWIGHEESPIEMERRRRQLDVVQQGRPITRSTLELHRGRQRREVKERGEQQRGRRQTTDPDQLCPTVASFVMPRAAVNSQGDWMFIVNMNDQPEFQQLVRSEVCISDNCRGLCSVPPGLSTKCSQQYVQKKLIALHPNGDRLVEDMFWFPSCCVCQVTQN